jgi:hypothetical protein
MFMFMFSEASLVSYLLLAPFLSPALFNIYLNTLVVFHDLPCCTHRCELRALLDKNECAVLCSDC